MRHQVENSKEFLLTNENGFLEILDLKEDVRKKVECVYYHTNNDLYLFKVDGIIMHNFILTDEVVSWVKENTEVK
jgi:hypothetical protein